MNLEIFAKRFQLWLNFSLSKSSHGLEGLSSAITRISPPEPLHPITGRIIRCGITLPIAGRYCHRRFKTTRR